LGPEVLESINKRIILLRVSGFGQAGEHMLRPGHDLNFGQQQKPQFPNNYAADFAACMLGITGTMAALLERQKTGLGQVVDCSLMHCSRYMGLPLSHYKEDKFVSKYQDEQGKEYIASFSIK
jgi:alpha-methylacyl-CoA racemase